MNKLTVIKTIKFSPKQVKIIVAKAKEIGISFGTFVRIGAMKKAKIKENNE